MERELDVRGLRCPVPYARAKALVPELRPGDVLVVLATDPEAPVDLGALAADEALAFSAATRPDGVLRITLRR
jgi:tRNA 2-thiouridine synthesizing protein A